MQSKWILQTVLRIFSCPRYEQALASLRSFLPLTLQKLTHAVLSPKLARALHMLRFLAHCTTSTGPILLIWDPEHPDPATGVSSSLEEVLDMVTPELTCAELQAYHRPATRLSTMTIYKRFLNECHKLLVGRKLDQEASARASEVERLIATQADTASQNLTGDDGVFSFEKLRKLLEAWFRSCTWLQCCCIFWKFVCLFFRSRLLAVAKASVSLKQKASELPSDPGSQHWKVKQNALSMFEEHIKDAGQKTVVAILDLLQSADVVEKCMIPNQLMELSKFVKGEQPRGMAGKANPDGPGFKVLKALPYAERSVLVYVADVVAAMTCKGAIDIKNLDATSTPPFSSETAVLDYIDAISDSSRCVVGSLLDATKTMRRIFFQLNSF